MTTVSSFPTHDLEHIARDLLPPSDPGDAFAGRAVPALVAVLRTAQLLEMPPSHLLRELSAQGLAHFCAQLRRVPDAQVQRSVDELLSGASEPPTDFNEDRFLFSAWNALLHRACLTPDFDARLDASLETLQSRRSV